MQQVSVKLPKKPYKWSGAGPIPSVGSEVKIGMNKLGSGTVLGYSKLHGESGSWLGIWVKLLNPPEWFKERNSNWETGLFLFFGRDVEQ